MNYYGRWVYLLISQDETLCKIGISRNPHKRTRIVSSTNGIELKLVGAFQGNFRDEAKAHEVFKDARIFSEWFAYDRGILDYFKAQCGYLPRSAILPL